MLIKVHTDGGARGNPGPAAVGVVIEEVKSEKLKVKSEIRTIIEFGKRIGEATNNVAEYRAVIEALNCLKSQIPQLNDPMKLRGLKPSVSGETPELLLPSANAPGVLHPWAKAHGFRHGRIKQRQIIFYLDSNLVVNQLNGRFKVKDPQLRELLTQIRILEQELGGGVQYALVPREQNRRADFLVNQALGYK